MKIDRSIPSIVISGPPLIEMNYDDERRIKMEQERKPTREDMPFDVVEKPAHYNTGKYEHKAVAENWEMSAYIYCATKYIMRAPHKGKLLEDLRKGRWYMREINRNPALAIAQYGYWQSNNNKPGPKFPKIFSVDDVATDWAKGDDTYRSIFICIGDAILYATSEFHMTRLLVQATQLLEGKIAEAEKA